MSAARGKLIVLYGINNLGKSTQARILVDALQAKGIRASYLKYPLYDLVPSGPMLNAYLREGNPDKLGSREFQMLQVMNRTQYDAALEARLASGEWIVAEDYVGTGIAWGMGAGVDREWQELMNAHLVKADCALLFQGQRFMEAQEKNHKHESDNELTERVRKAHDALGRDFGWIRIDANRSIEEIATEVLSVVMKAFRL
ncbi:MAG: hypothetical protein HY422_03415 [Candidatus Komeilibacteria bacterium]|nr:hypothetical protein [Candidatus Komeilibacteria bacterium]